MPFQDLPERLAAVRETIERARHRGGHGQEAVTKMSQVEADLRWHLIGHLQRNKVKQLDGFRLVHSMDSARLADALAAYGTTRGRPVEVLMQVNVSGEGTK